MTKIILVNSCKECPKVVENNRHYLICPDSTSDTNIIGKVSNDLEIPDWCPLKNVTSVENLNQFFREVMIME